jgi:hypothetical protein
MRNRIHQENAATLRLLQVAYDRGSQEAACALEVLASYQLMRVSKATECLEMLAAAQRRLARLNGAGPNARSSHSRLAFMVAFAEASFLDKFGAAESAHLAADEALNVEVRQRTRAHRSLERALAVTQARCALRFGSADVVVPTEALLRAGAPDIVSYFATVSSCVKRRHDYVGAAVAYDQMFRVLRNIDRAAYAWAWLGDCRVIRRHLGPEVAIDVMAGVIGRARVSRAAGRVDGRWTRLAPQYLSGPHNLLKLADDHGGEVQAVEALIDLSVLWTRDDADAAIVLAVLACRVTEDIRYRLPEVWLRRSFARDAGPAYAALLDQLLSRHDHAGAALAIEAARGQSLFEGEDLIQRSRSANERQIARKIAVPSLLDLSMAGYSLRAYLGHSPATQDIPGIREGEPTDLRRVVGQRAHGSWRAFWQWESGEVLYWAIFGDGSGNAAGSMLIREGSAAATALEELDGCLPGQVGAETPFDATLRARTGSLAMVSRRSEERLLARRLGRALVPPDLTKWVTEQADGEVGSLLVGPSNSTSRVPWSWLGVSDDLDRRLIEAVRVVLCPPVGLQRLPSPRRDESSRWRVRVAVTDPDGSLPDSRAVYATARAAGLIAADATELIGSDEHSTDRSKIVINALRTMNSLQDAFLFVGHGVGTTSRSGAALVMNSRRSDNLTVSALLHDLSDTVLNGSALLLACDSSAAEADEWYSIAPALIALGLDEVVVTVSPVMASPAVAAVEGRLITERNGSEQWSEVLRRVQITELEHWRQGKALSAPVYWAPIQVVSYS